MNTTNPHDSDASDNAWRQMCAQQWQDAMDQDDTDFDMDLLAACAENRATAEEVTIAHEIMAGSPAALACFLAMRDQVGENHASIPLQASRSSAATWPVTALLSVAASLLVAVSAAVWGISERSGKHSVQNQMAALQTDFSATAESLTEQQLKNRRQNLLGKKEQGMAMAAQRKPLFLAGAISPELLATAMLTIDGANARGPESPVEKDLRMSVSGFWTDAVQTLDVDTLERDIERAVQLITGDDLKAADDAVQRLRRIAPDEPAVRNLQAVLLLAQAEEAPLAAGEMMRQDARRQLVDLTRSHPQFALAWLNLALISQQQEGPTAAESAWRNYLKAETDPALQDVVARRIHPD